MKRRIISFKGLLALGGRGREGGRVRNDLKLACWEARTEDEDPFKATGVFRVKGLEWENTKFRDVVNFII